MNREPVRFLEKADRAISAAQRLLEGGDIDFAAGRAYYAMFYAAQALLAERQIAFRKHSGVHAAFGEHFARTGLLDVKYHRWLLDAFDKRLQADYGFDSVLSHEDSSDLIARAGEFVAAVRKLLSV